MLFGGGTEERAVCGSRGEWSVSDTDLLKEDRTSLWRVGKIQREPLGYCT